MVEIEFQATHNALKVCTCTGTIKKFVFTWLQLFRENMDTTTWMWIMSDANINEKLSDSIEIN